MSVKRERDSDDDTHSKQLKRHRTTVVDSSDDEGDEDYVQLPDDTPEVEDFKNAHIPKGERFCC